MSNVQPSVADSAPIILPPDPPVAALESKEEQRRRQIEQNQAAIQLLHSWRNGDQQEQRETLEYLTQVLDEDRFSTRKLFP